ncbi:MAG: peroxiredoxin [Verrucomicrobiota bacterium]
MILLLSLVTMLTGAFAPAARADLPKAGDAAPDFTLQGTDGKTYKLSEFKDKKPVVVAWFPKAFTSGCTAECKSMQANTDALRKFDVAYFTASCDDVETNKKFADSLGLGYPILSDPTRETAKAYGLITGDKKNASRVTFYISKDGRILLVDDKVKTATHGADVAAKLKELGIAESH